MEKIYVQSNLSTKATQGIRQKWLLQAGGLFIEIYLLRFLNPSHFRKWPLKVPVKTSLAHLFDIWWVCIKCFIPKYLSCYPLWYDEPLLCCGTCNILYWTVKLGHIFETTCICSSVLSKISRKGFKPKTSMKT